MLFTMYGVFVLLLSQIRTRTKFTVPEAHFHAESIGASPVVIACKMAMLFKFLHLQTQCDPTIVLSWVSCSQACKGPAQVSY